MSSGYVPDEEYRQIKQSWRSAPPGQATRHFDYGSARENLDRCHANLRQLAKQEAELRELYDRLPPGDSRRLAHKNGEEEIPSLPDRIRKNRSEQLHWRNYIDHYQRLAMKEPPPRRPTDPLPIEQDRRLPREREPGDDDEPIPGVAP